jgi:hypothetical protein
MQKIQLRSGHESQLQGMGKRHLARRREISWMHDVKDQIALRRVRRLHGSRSFHTILARF